MKKPQIKVTVKKGQMTKGKSDREQVVADLQEHIKRVKGKR